MKMELIGYQGILTDKLETMQTRKTKIYTNYQEAYKAIERLSKKYYMNNNRDILAIKPIYK